jgi:pilus assembly protein Flp/PilA
MHLQDLRSTTCSKRRKYSATKGQGLVEYTMILALLAIVVILVLSLLGPAVGNVFSSVSSGLQSPGNRSVQQVNPVVTTTRAVTTTTAAPVVTTAAPTTVATTATTVATTPTTAVTFFFNPKTTPTPEHGKGDGNDG